MREQSDLEPLRDVVERLNLSVEAAVSSDQDFRETVTVRTADLAMVVAALKDRGGPLLDTMVGTVQELDDNP